MPDRTINPRYLPWTMTAPSGTQVLAPQINNLDFGLVLLESLSIFTPSGHNGLTGIALYLAGIPIVPYGSAVDFIIGDNTVDNFEVGIQVDQGLQLVAYNTDDAFDHSWYLRFKVRDIDARTSSGPTGIVTPITAAPTIRSA